MSVCMFKDMYLSVNSCKCVQTNTQMQVTSLPLLKSTPSPLPPFPSSCPQARFHQSATAEALVVARTVAATAARDC